MTYLLNFPRPIGLEPTIYQIKPEIIPESVEIEPGCFDIDPYSNPDIIECRTIMEALITILKYNHTESYRNEIKFK